MSTFGWSHLSGVGSITTASVTVPGGPNQAVQYNKNGAFAGDLTMTFDDTVGTKTLTVDKVKPNVIIDSTNSVGMAGQVLSSTGTALQFINPPVQITYTANFSSDIARSHVAGSSVSLVLDTETFATGLTFPTPAPVFSMEVIQSGTYICSYHVDFEGNGPGSGNYSTFLRRIAPSALTLQPQRITCYNNEQAQSSDTFLLTLTAGEIWCLQMTGIPAWTTKNINIVFHTV